LNIKKNSFKKTATSSKFGFNNFISFFFFNRLPLQLSGCLFFSSRCLSPFHEPEHSFPVSRSEESNDIKKSFGKFALKVLYLFSLAVSARFSLLLTEPAFLLTSSPSSIVSTDSFDLLFFAVFLAASLATNWPIDILLPLSIALGLRTKKLSG